MPKLLPVTRNTRRLAFGGWNYPRICSVLRYEVHYNTKLS